MYYSCYYINILLGLSSIAKSQRPSGKAEAVTLQFKRIFRIKNFSKLLRFIFSLVRLTVGTSLAIIYVEDVLKVPSDIAKWIPIPFQISALIGLQIWAKVSNKLNRISALNYGAIIWIISCTTALFYLLYQNFQELEIFYFKMQKHNFVYSFNFHNLSYWHWSFNCFSYPWSLLPDAIDEDQRNQQDCILHGWYLFRRLASH